MPMTRPPPRSSLPKFPQGYRDWKWISSAHEEGNLNDLRRRSGQRCSDQRLPGREATVPGRHNHCCSALSQRPVGGEQQSLWPGPIFRSRGPHEHSVHGQGLKKVRGNRRLGVRSLRRRQTWRRGVYENLLPLPREDESDRPCLYSLRTLKPGHSLHVYRRLLTPKPPPEGGSNLNR